MMVERDCLLMVRILDFDFVYIESPSMRENHRACNDFRILLENCIDVISHISDRLKTMPRHRNDRRYNRNKTNVNTESKGKEIMKQNPRQSIDFTCRGSAKKFRQSEQVIKFVLIILNPIVEHSKTSYLKNRCSINKSKQTQDKKTKNDEKIYLIEKKKRC